MPPTLRCHKTECAVSNVVFWLLVNPVHSSAVLRAHPLSVYCLRFDIAHATAIVLERLLANTQIFALLTFAESFSCWRFYDQQLGEPLSFLET